MAQFPKTVKWSARTLMNVCQKIHTSTIVTPTLEFVEISTEATIALARTDSRMKLETALYVQTTMNAMEKGTVTTVSEELNVQITQDLLNAGACLDSTIFMTLKTGTSVVTFKSTATTVTVVDAHTCVRFLTAKGLSGDVTAP